MDCFQIQWLSGFAKRVTGFGKFHPNQGNNVAGASFFNFLPVFGMNFINSANTFRFIFGGIYDLHSAFQCT